MAAVAVVSAAVALLAACEREVIYLENNKPGREIPNKLKGVWVRCGEAPYTDEICYPDPSTVTFNDTLIFTDDSLTITPARNPEKYAKNLYEYNDRCVVTYRKSYDKTGLLHYNITPLIEYYGGDFFAPAKISSFEYAFISDTALNIYSGIVSIYGIYNSHQRVLCYRKVE